MIEIHLYGKLRKYSIQQSPLKESIVYMDLIEDETIGDIAFKMGIPSCEMSDCIFLNGEYSGLSRKVKDGDRIGLFPDNMLLLYRQHFSRVDK
jgi:hypothetical protein